MSKVISILRFAVLLTLAFLGLVALFTSPSDDLTADIWLMLLIGSKALGLGLIYLAVVAAEAWLPYDPILRAIRRFAVMTCRK